MHFLQAISPTSTFKHNNIMDNEKKTNQDINPSLKGKKLWDFTVEERAAMSAEDLGSLYMQSMVDGIASHGEEKETKPE